MTHHVEEKETPRACSDIKM